MQPYNITSHPERNLEPVTISLYVIGIGISLIIAIVLGTSIFSSESFIDKIRKQEKKLRDLCGPLDTKSFFKWVVCVQGNMALLGTKETKYKRFLTLFSETTFNQPQLELIMSVPSRDNTLFSLSGWDLLKLECSRPRVLVYNFYKFLFKVQECIDNFCNLECFQGIPQEELKGVIAAITNSHYKWQGKKITALLGAALRTVMLTTFIGLQSDERFLSFEKTSFHRSWLALTIPDVKGYTGINTLQKLEDSLVADPPARVFLGNSTEERRLSKLSCNGEMIITPGYTMLEKLMANPYLYSSTGLMAPTKTGGTCLLDQDSINLHSIRLRQGIAEVYTYM